MNEWRNSDEHQTLIISLTPIGGLWPTCRFPLRGRGKHCYFIKNYAGADVEDSAVSIADFEYYIY